MNVDPDYFWLMMLGGLIYTILLLFNLVETKRKFKFSIWFKENWLKSLMSIILANAILVTISNMPSLQGKINEVTAFGIGFGLDVLVKQSWKIRKKILEMVFPALLKDQVNEKLNTGSTDIDPQS